MFDKNKLEKLSAMKNVEADKITAENLAEINAELADKGITGLEVVTAGTVASLEAQVTEATAPLAAANETLTADLAAANSKVTDLEAKLAEANTKLGQKPAATAEEIKAEQDRIAREGQEDDLDTKMSNELKEKYGL